MRHQPLERLLPQANHSVYKLVRMAARRAMELVDGNPKLVEASPSTKVTTIALNEIAAGRVVLKEVAEQVEAVHKKSPKPQKKESLEKEEALAEEQRV